MGKETQINDRAFVIETRRISWTLAALKFELALMRFTGLALKYSPDQPRAPAGTSEGGRWMRLAGLIRVCIPVGISRNTDRFGNKWYTATYECRNDRTFTRTGQGEPPGLVLDPFDWND